MNLPLFRLFAPGFKFVLAASLFVSSSAFADTCPPLRNIFADLGARQGKSFTAETNVKWESNTFERDVIVIRFYRADIDDSGHILCRYEGSVANESYSSVDVLLHMTTPTPVTPISNDQTDWKRESICPPSEFNVANCPFNLAVPSAAILTHPFGVPD